VGRRSIAAVLVLVVVLAACSGEDEPVFGSAEVSRQTVVQTVAAAAVLEPAGRVTVSAPAAGEVTALAVADGDRVAAGDPLVTLRSESLEAQLEQAEAAVEATSVLAGTGLAGGLGASLGGGFPSGLDTGLAAGLDVAPVIGALRAQLDAVIPPVLGALEDQVAGLEAAVQAIGDAASAQGQATAAALREVADALGGRLPDELDVDPALLELPDPDEVLVPVDTSGLEEALADARAQLHTAQARYRDASAQLGAVEREAAASAAAQAAALAEAQAAAEEAQAAAEQAQEEAAALQREQAEAAVQAVQDRLDALAIVAPADGTV
jgi:multidrug efflux pump subunit AcrA (membrane-fusion protein)